MSILIGKISKYGQIPIKVYIQAALGSGHYANSLRIIYSYKYMNDVPAYHQL
jgi:hypothetical protein